MLFTPDQFAVRVRSFVLLAGLAVVLAGCGSNAAPDTSKVAVLNPAQSVASSDNLLSLYKKLDDVYESDMGAAIKQTEPEEKSIVDKLKAGPANLKDQLAKDHKMFAGGVDAAKQTLIHLSNSTSTDVDPMEHDKYVAYYAALGELVTARQSEYQAFLDYEQKPDDDRRQAVIQAATVLQGKELAYTSKKR